MDQDGLTRLDVRHVGEQGRRGWHHGWKGGCGAQIERCGQRERQQGGGGHIFGVATRHGESRHRLPDAHALDAVSKRMDIA